jgi:hypothetical protein
MKPGQIVAAVVITGALLAGSCGGNRDEQEALPGAFDDPGVAHVHGLGVDPADGTLYAATHTGIFTIPAKGKAERVADRYQDTMGFTVVGPRHFLGSGHPDQQDDELHVEGTRPLLGLIESTDAGATWHKRSLFGAADFHALVAAHGRVYGYEATGGRFLVTADNKTWETRNPGLALGAFAVSPTDPDTIVVTAEAGMVVSSDGGRTFEPLPAAPPAVTVAWDASRGLWAVAADGAVVTAPEPAGPWAEKGQLPGEPEAFLVTGVDLYAAVMSPAGRTAIYRSSDDAKTWELCYQDPT